MNIDRNAAREFICLLSDGGWHEIYELHSRYRLYPDVIFSLVRFFLNNGLIQKEGRMVRISDQLSNKHFALLNKLQKTVRPKALDNFEAGRLTYAYRYV